MAADRQEGRPRAQRYVPTYPDAIDLALCLGWIDGQKKGLDEQHSLQRFTPRRAKSIWSKINVAKVAVLIEAGRMQPAGQAQIDAAKADGRWGGAYDGARTSTMPDDLQAALDATPVGKEILRDDQCHQSLCSAVARADRREAADARKAHRAIGRDARAWRGYPHRQAEGRGISEVGIDADLSVADIQMSRRFAITTRSKCRRPVGSLP